MARSCRAAAHGGENSLQKSAILRVFPGQKRDFCASKTSSFCHFSAVFSDALADSKHVSDRRYHTPYGYTHFILLSSFERGEAEEPEAGFLGLRVVAMRPFWKNSYGLSIANWGEMICKSGKRIAGME
jgi:hypothetical protein